MNTFLWILFILLIALGLIYIGALLAISILICVYVTDVEFWNTRIQPYLTDLRNWVDAGNRMKDYPKDRFNKHN